MKSITKVIFEFIKKNYVKVDRYSSYIFNVLMSLNLIVLVYSLWSINTNESTNTSSLLIILGIQVFITLFVLINIFYNWSKKSEQTRLNKNIFLAVMFIIIFAIPMTYLMLYIGRALSVNEGVQIGSADGWLSFIGSIIGGVITMIAVVYTIQHERIMNSNQSIPYFEVKTEDNISISALIVSLSNIDAFGVIPIYIKNISKHNAIDFKIKYVGFSSIQPLKKSVIKKEDYKDLIESSYFGNIFTPDEVRHIYLPLSLNLYKEMYFSLELEFECFDNLKVKKYKMRSVSFIGIHLEEIERDAIPDNIGKRVSYKVKFYNTSMNYLNL